MVPDVRQVRVRRLAAIRDASFGGKSTALARAIKRSASQVSQWMTGVRTITEESARHIEAELALPRGALDVEEGAVALVREDDRGSTYTARPAQPSSPGERPIGEHGPSFNYGARLGRVQVPVIGRTMGGVPDRVWDDEGRPTGITDEFAELATDDARAFLVRVEGDSMAPKYDPGAFALVEPSVEPELGDDVLVRLTSGETVLKRLLSRAGGSYRLCSLATNAVLTYRADEVAWVYYVAHPVPARRLRSRL